MTELIDVWLFFSVESLSRRFAGQPVFANAACASYFACSVVQVPSFAPEHCGSHVDGWPMHGICGVTDRFVETEDAKIGEGLPAHAPVPGGTDWHVPATGSSEIFVEEVPIFSLQL